MKKLYIIRHAKSDWEYPELTDFERPINARGRIDAPAIGDYLHKNNIKPDYIYSSPANRAITTARIVCYQLGFPFEGIQIKEKIYDATLGDLVSILQTTPDDKNEVILFGHNPGLTYLIEYLTGELLDSLPTCGVYGVEFNKDFYSWKDLYRGSGKGILFTSPKKLG
ncbi:MAG: histidine phosphatase family protein [Bacteroidetes bacterium]|nr:histidine phosphatase family protein [Bacteroidota bacterium]